MKTIVVLIDTVKKDFLKIYNENTWVDTPNINDFAADSLVFDNHYVGSMPCMPARRDIMTGRLNFLERSWGPIEAFDVTFPKILRNNNIYTHITTDHTHYLNISGEGYMQQFNTWDFHRGQEGDPWISRIEDPDDLPDEYFGKVRRQHHLNRTTWEDNPDNYPTSKTFLSACNWLEDNKNKDGFFMMVEVFDPHEPFDVPDEYLEKYNDHYTGKYFVTPDYGEVDVPDGALEHIRNRYAALLTMVDEYFGKLINKLKELEMYEDTLIIFTSDHGFYLGEKNLLGKNVFHAYNEVAGIPLFVKDSQNRRIGEREKTVTQAIDIMPTILDYYNLDIPSSVRGKSWYSLFENKENNKGYAIYGNFGSTVNITDGEYTYLRTPNIDNEPLHEYTTSLATHRRYLGSEFPEKVETGRYFERTDYPIYKVPVLTNEEEKKHREEYMNESMLFNIIEGPEQLNNIEDKNLREKYKEKLVELLKYHDSPEDQYQRLGLQDYREKR